MQPRRLILSALFLLVLISGVVLSASARAEDYGQIITPAPAPKEAVIVPQGYVNCFTVSAGWYQDAWYPEHKVCQYDSAKTVSTVQGDAWVDGYWTCVKSQKGNCTKWDWRPGHWVKTFTVY